MALDIRWHGCDLATGRIVADLTDARTQSGISSVVAAYTSASLELPIPLSGPGNAPADWLAATHPGRSMLVCVLSGQPVWAGIPLTRRRGSAPTAAISCVSLEGYLDRRYVGDHTWTSQDEASVIANGLLGDANTNGIGLVVDAPATGTLRTRTYADQDDKTVYSALRELAGVTDGPEWTIALRWANSSQNRIEKVAVVRKRIGVAAAIPDATFDTRAAAVLDSSGGSTASYEYTEDYSAERGANWIVATSSGQGDARPQSSPQSNILTGMPRWERRFQPSSSITDTAVLDQHAARALALMYDGAVSISITARADANPILGTHWGLGDDIGYDLAGHGHPDGLTGVARAVGWVLDPEAGIVKPILVEEGDE